MFTDRLLATLVHLRHGVTHAVPACWDDVNRSTITRAIGELRLLLAERACTSVPVGACGPSPAPATRAWACRLTGT
ncbi:transposase family protein [Streptomyces olivaceoviridis]|uniref:Transposase family protein n=1 Tax=Streptomyces olivaceoviridis TaxID=1921 RepID=A0ABW7VL83_STROI